MKATNGVKKISVKADTADSEIFKMVIEQDKGAKKLHVAPGLLVYVMSEGTIVEIYGSGFCYPSYLFGNSNIVVSFKINNIQKMAALLQQNGSLLLGKIETVCSSYQYCHMLTKEKTVIGLYELSDAKDK